MAYRQFVCWVRKGQPLGMKYSDPTSLRCQNYKGRVSVRVPIDHQTMKIHGSTGIPTAKVEQCILSMSTNLCRSDVGCSLFPDVGHSLPLLTIKENDYDFTQSLF
jgi:hypothetical protein